MTTSRSVSGPQPRRAQPSWRLKLVVLPVLIVMALLARASEPTPVQAASWTADASGTTDFLFDIACVSGTYCKAVGANGTIRSFNGTTWSAEPSPFASEVRGVACASTTFCKAVSPVGGGASYDGVRWTRDSAPLGLRGVSCLSATFCKAVGEVYASAYPPPGVIMTWNGSVWRSDSNFLPSALNSVSCVAETSCKAVGRSGLVMSYNGQTWTRESVPFLDQATHLTSVSCPTASFCMAAGTSGSQGIIVQYADGVWTVSARTPREMFGVSCVLRSFCKATGYNGQTALMYSFNGAAWTQDSIPTTRQLWPISCSYTNFCKTGGISGVIFSLVAPLPTPQPVTISFGGCTVDPPPFIQTVRCVVSFRDSGSIPAVASGSVTVTFLGGQSQPLGQFVGRCPTDGGMGANRCGAVTVVAPYSMWVTAVNLQVRYEPDAGFELNRAAQRTFLLH